MTSVCGAKKRQGEGYCQRPAGWGTPNTTGPCKLHGGSTRSAAIAAHRVQVEQYARAVLDNPDALPISDVDQELMRLAGRVLAAVDAVGARVNHLTEISVVTMAGGEQIKAEVQAWDKLLARFHGLLVDIRRLGIEDRIAGTQERNSEVFGSLLRLFADEIGLTPEQQARVPDVVPRVLQTLSA